MSKIYFQTRTFVSIHVRIGVLDFCLYTIQTFTESSRLDPNARRWYTFENNLREVYWKSSTHVSAYATDRMAE